MIRGDKARHSCHHWLRSMVVAISCASHACLGSEVSLHFTLNPDLEALLSLSARQRLESVRTQYGALGDRDAHHPLARTRSVFTCLFPRSRQVSLSYISTRCKSEEFQGWFLGVLLPCDDFCDKTMKESDALTPNGASAHHG